MALLYDWRREENMSRSATPVSRNGTGSLAGVSDSNGGVFEEDDIRRYASNKMPLPGWNRQKYLERDQLSCNKPSAGRGAFSPSADKAAQRTITAELQPFEAVTLFHGVRRKVRIPLERRVLQVSLATMTENSMCCQCGSYISVLLVPCITGVCMAQQSKLGTRLVQATQVAACGYTPCTAKARVRMGWCYADYAHVSQMST